MAHPIPLIQIASQRLDSCTAKGGIFLYKYIRTLTLTTDEAHLQDAGGIVYLPKRRVILNAPSHILEMMQWVFVARMSLSFASKRSRSSVISDWQTQRLVVAVSAELTRCRSFGRTQSSVPAKIGDCGSQAFRSIASSARPVCCQCLSSWGARCLMFFHCSE